MQAAQPPAIEMPALVFRNDDTAGKLIFRYNNDIPWKLFLGNNSEPFITVNKDGDLTIHLGVPCGPGLPCKTIRSIRVVPEGDTK
jgi:hypothetical protein